MTVQAKLPMIVIKPSSAPSLKSHNNILSKCVLTEQLPPKTETKVSTKTLFPEWAFFLPRLRRRMLLKSGLQNPNWVAFVQSDFFCECDIICQTAASLQWVRINFIRRKRFSFRLEDGTKTCNILFFVGKKNCLNLWTVWTFCWSSSFLLLKVTDWIVSVTFYVHFAHKQNLAEQKKKVYFMKFGWGKIQLSVT